MTVASSSLVKKVTAALEVLSGYLFLLSLEIKYTRLIKDIIIEQKRNKFSHVMYSIVPPPSIRGRKKIFYFLFDRESNRHRLVTPYLL